MIHWAWRQWLAEPWRAVLASVAFGTVAALCLLFEGLRFGLIDRLRAFPASLPADLVAVERGNRNFAMVPSELPQLARAEAEAVPGVAAAHPLMLLPVIVEWNGLRSPIVLVAYTTAGGPTRFRSGVAPASERELAVDASLAQRHRVKAGDTVEILDRAFQVSGLSADSSSPFAPYAFMTYDELLSLLLESDLPIGLDDASLLAMLLVELSEGADLEEARAALQRAVPDADFYTPAELGREDAALGRRLLGPVLGLLSTVAWVIGVLTMALLRYADVQARIPEHGVQAALGAGRWQMGAGLAAGGALVAVSALPVTLLMARALSLLVTRWNPLYEAQIWVPQVLVPGLLLLFGAAAAGSLLPLRRLMRLDPVVVFQR